MPHVRIKLRASPRYGQQKALSSNWDERAQHAFRGSTHVPRGPGFSDGGRALKLAGNGATATIYWLAL